MILNTAIFLAVVTTARAKAADTPAWSRALERAITEIQRARYWSYADGVLTLQSTTSNKLYKIGADHTCEARNGICKHRAARRLMELYFAALKIDAGGQCKAVSPAAQRQAERDKAILVKPQPPSHKYGCFDI